MDKINKDDLSICTGKLEIVVDIMLSKVNELVEENDKIMQIIRNIGMRLDDHIEK